MWQKYAIILKATISVSVRPVVGIDVGIAAIEVEVAPIFYEILPKLKTPFSTSLIGKPALITSEPALFINFTLTLYAFTFCKTNPFCKG